MDARVHRQSVGDLENAGMISARGMALQKRLFPLAAVLALAATVVAIRYTWPANTVLLAGAIVVSLVGDILTGVRLFGQADEVIDVGDYLLVRKNDREVRIPLRDLIKVSATFWGVTLHLAQPVEFGSTIAFSPQRALGRGAVVMSLRSRMQAAKRPH
jgi:hypothetical protein